MKKNLLAQKKCTSCREGMPALSQDELANYIGDLHQDWCLNLDNNKIKRIFKFKNFRHALILANQIADIADEENHHPNLLIRWGALEVEIWTHVTGKLYESDFILAAKIDAL